MSFMWFTLGILVVILFWGANSWITKKQISVSALSWAGIIASIVCIVFTIAWVWTSIFESEAQAARAGLLIFGVISLVLLGVTRQLVVKDIKRSS